MESIPSQVLLNGLQDRTSNRTIPETAEDVERRNSLVLEYLPLVTAIARRTMRNLPSHLELDDLVQAGTLGLIDAAAKYDPKKQVGFATYANHRIRGAILDSLRQLDHASRTIRHRAKQVSLVRDELTSSLDRTPNDAEVAQGLGISLESLRKTMLELRSISQMSIPTRSQGKEDYDLQFSCGIKAQPDWITGRIQLQSELGQAIATLPPSHKRVLLLYHGHNLKMAEIGRIIGICESRVSQIHSVALEAMGVALRAKGINSSRLFLL